MDVRCVLLLAYLVVVCGDQSVVGAASDDANPNDDKTADDSSSIKANSCTRDDNGNVENNGCTQTSGRSDLYKEDKGHMKPFGQSGTVSPITEIDMFPGQTEFFRKWMIPSLPVLMKGAATLSPAYHKWTDAFLYQLSGEPENRNVVLDMERGKKEKRKDAGDGLPLRDFLEVYNTSDVYLVTAVPAFLRPYVVKPCPLQCRVLESVFTTYTMWMSSGGTKSVVHTDGLENILCLFRGNKTLHMLDEASINVRSVIDKVDGSYSSLDVDKVDLSQFPTLRGAEFIRADMKAGDCLYIPYGWIHQVNSFGSNIGVNVWLNTKSLHTAIKQGHCVDNDPPCDPTFTLQQAKHADIETINANDQVEFSDLRYLFQHASFRGKACVNPDSPPTKSQEKVKLKEFLELVESEGVLPAWILDLEDEEQLSSELNTFFVAIEQLDEDQDSILTSQELEAGEELIEAFYAH